MEVLRVKNKTSLIVFPLVTKGGTDYITGATFAAGDVKVSKDSGAFANIATLPTEIGTSGWYYINPTAAEHNADKIIISLIDQTATKVWEDQGIVINTREYVDAILDERLTGATHNEPTSLARRMRAIGDVVSGTVDDPSPTTTSFITDLAGGHDNHYADQTLFFTDSSLAGMNRIIVSFDDATKRVTFDEPLPIAPPNGTAFDVDPVHVHPLSQIVDAVWNAIMSKSNYDIPNSAGRDMRLIFQSTSSLTGVVGASPAPTTTSFISDIAGYDTNAFNDQLIRFVDGTLSGQTAAVLSYNTDGTFTFDEPFTQEPAAGDEFLLIPDHIHPVSQIADAVFDKLNTEVVAELSAIPSGAAAVIPMISLIFRYLRNHKKITDLFETLYKDDGTTVLGQSAITGDETETDKGTLA